jgi:tRNA nucleotidyltransferase/poly(A) polymerase
VGSAVRDSLLGRPLYDFDVATTHVPEKVTELFRSHGFQVYPTGIEHGTVTVNLHGHIYEITTLRTDIETDGRHAHVRYTQNWEEDAARRDFTMNALYVDAKGQLYDYWGGLQDLEAGIVRFIGNPLERIQEDYLRILRFFRFSVFYSKKGFESKGLDACNMMQSGIRTLSKERITKEIFRIFEAPSLSSLFDVWEREGFDQAFLEVIPLSYQPIRSCLELEKSWGVKASPLLRLWILVDGQNTCLRLTKAQASLWESMCAYSGDSQIKDNALNMDAPALLALYGLEEATIYIWLSAIDDKLKSNQQSSPENQIWSQKLANLNNQQTPEFPLRGADLLALNVSPGKHVGLLLDEVKQWWVEHNCTPDRDACLGYLNTLL